jgi:hypothetical protein
MKEGPGGIEKREEKEDEEADERRKGKEVGGRFFSLFFCATQTQNPRARHGYFMI